MSSETTERVNRMTSTPSPQERRILVAVVTGSAGERIQAWRRINDPEQAERLPPHATLCYWAPPVKPELLERQVRHAFGRPVSVRLGGVEVGDNDQRTFFVAVKDTAALEAAHARLYDGTYVELPGRDVWRWHVTCVRDSRDRNADALRRAARDLTLDQECRIDTVAYLELQGERYVELARWSI